MNQNVPTIVELFVNAETDRDCELVRQRIEEGGYSGFNELLDHLKHQLKLCDETTMDGVQAALAKAKEMIPQPGKISPSWEYIWEEMERFLRYKQEVFSRVPHTEREGEWQIVMDNPFTNDNIVCYPGLSFTEGAYLYAYFRDRLRDNEYIRLQKVVHVIVTEGKQLAARKRHAGYF